MTLSSFTYALIAGLLPSLIWLWFWLREDSEHGEPRWLLTVSFAGGVVVVVFALMLEKMIADNVIDDNLKYTLWAATEEILKFLVVAVIVLKSRYNDEPLKAMIYCIVVALGFAALENALFLMEPIAMGTIAQSIITGNMRFIGATLVHIVSSAAVGFAIGLTFYSRFTNKLLTVFLGLIAAISIHAAFNISIVNAASNDILKVFAWIWGAVIILIILFEEVKAVRPRYIRER
ncbi:MAG: PrsW family glutamic-type intramembrane protease [Candidatus Taylorbacteria bacterium]